MNVLVDTNVVISALLRDGPPRRVINEQLARDDWFWIVTAEIETEYREVLARPKFKIPSAVQQDFQIFVEASTIRVPAASPPPFARDPKDELFMKGNRAGTWSVTVSGNCRVTFTFEGEDAFDVDLEDYH